MGGPRGSKVPGRGEPRYAEGRGRTVDPANGPTNPGTRKGRPRVGPALSVPWCRSVLDCVRPVRDGEVLRATGAVDVGVAVRVARGRDVPVVRAVRVVRPDQGRERLGVGGAVLAHPGDVRG